MKRQQRLKNHRRRRGKRSSDRLLPVAAAAAEELSMDAANVADEANLTDRPSKLWLPFKKELLFLAPNPTDC